MKAKDRFVVAASRAGLLAFARGKKAAVVVTVLIVLFGLGAGIGAGIFPAGELYRRRT